MVRNVTAVSHSFSVDLNTLELGISDASLGRIDSRGGRFARRSGFEWRSPDAESVQRG